MLRAATQTLRSVAPVSRALIARSAGAAAAVRAAVPHASPRVRFFAAAAAAAAPASSYIMLNESTQSLSSILSSATPNTLVVAYFTASWCGPCRAIAPVFERLSKDYTGKVTFVKIDVDDNASTAESARIQAVPTFKFFKAGKELTSMSGANAQGLQNRVEELSKNA